MTLSKRRLVAVVLALALLAGGAIAYTTVFTAGGGTSYETDSGLVVNTATDHGLDDANPFNGSFEVYINGLSVTASGDAEVTIDQFEGSTTDLSGIDASANLVDVNPGDKPSAGINGDVTDLSWSAASLEGDEVALTYSASGSGDLAMTDLAPDTDWSAATPQGELVDNGTTTAGGEAAINVDPATNQDVILFTNHAPQATNLSPSNGTQLTTSSTEFQVDVNDTEFPTQQGDEVTATLYIDDTAVDSETVTTNTTVSIAQEFPEGGDHDYYWQLEDAYGATNTTDTNTVLSPSSLAIRSETNPEQLVSDANVNITYYYGDEILRANTTTGEVDLAGLPVDEPIIARAEADGYHPRTAAITDLYQQDTLYLLNNSLDSHQLIFDISDPTGLYPRSETILEVQRDINLSGNTEWRTVAGDVFGAQGVTTDLQAGERYRLVIRNLDTMETAVLGAFTPTGSQQITLEPESTEVDIGLEENVSVGYGAHRGPGGESIVVEYTDPDQETDTLTFNIHERGNESNVLLANTSFSSLGNLSYSEPLSASEQNQTWVVDFHWTRGTTSSHAWTTLGTGTRSLLPSSLDPVYRVSVGVAILLITALLFSQLNVGVGAVVTSLVGGLLWYLGFLDTVTTGPAIVLSLAVGGLVYYNSGGGPG